jgi:hypothetical protein
MNTHMLIARLRMYAGYVVILLLCTFAGSALAVTLTGDANAGGKGLLIALPVAQVAFSLLFVRAGAALGPAFAAGATVLAFFGTFAAVELYQIRLVNDHKRVFDVLAVYALISIAYWEAVAWGVRAWRLRALRVTEGDGK